jgi:hypothetical protein
MAPPCPRSAAGRSIFCRPHGRHPCRLSNHRDYACALANGGSEYPRRTHTGRSGSRWPSWHRPAHFLRFLPSSRLGCTRSTTTPVCLAAFGETAAALRSEIAYPRACFWRLRNVGLLHKVAPSPTRRGPLRLLHHGHEARRTVGDAASTYVLKPQLRRIMPSARRLVFCFGHGFVMVRRAGPRC